MRPLFIAWEQNSDGSLYYVSEYPGEGGVDWGFTRRPNKAKKMPLWWLRRFLKNRRVCGAHSWQYGFRELTEKEIAK